MYKPSVLDKGLAHAELEKMTCKKHNVVADYRARMPALCDYLEHTRCYSRAVVLDVCRIATQLVELGYDLTRIQESDVEKIVVKLSETFGNATKSWWKNARCNVTKIVDFNGVCANGQ